MAPRSLILSGVVAVALGFVVSMAALFIVGVLSSGYALRDQQVVGGILVGGPLVGLVVWAATLRLQRQSGVIDTRAANVSNAAVGAPPTTAPPLGTHEAERREPLPLAAHVALFMAGLSISVPCAFMGIALRAPFRGQAHFTELGTAWHDHDSTVLPLSGLALGMLGCAMAYVGIRCGMARSLPLGVAIGCVGVGALMALAK